MTLRELVLDECGDLDPEVALTAAVLVLRTQEQGEGATIEGCAAGVADFKAHYGPVTWPAVRRWLDELGPQAERELPRRVLELAVADEHEGRDGWPTCWRLI